MYYLEIQRADSELLAGIRHWDNLKAAISDEMILVKDFTEEQIHSGLLRQIPGIKLYELKEQFLFLKGSLLPSKKMPSALLWSPIARALPIQLPKYNLNFFGIQEKVIIKLVPSDNIRTSFALLSKLENVEKSIVALPEIRLKSLQWAVLEKRALFLGTPLLPFKGITYWRLNNFLLPTGYEFELPLTSGIVADLLNRGKENWILVQNDNSCIVIPKNDFKQLSLSSFRLSIKQVF